MQIWLPSIFGPKNETFVNKIELLYLKDQVKETKYMDQGMFLFNGKLQGPFNHQKHKRDEKKPGWQEWLHPNKPHKFISQHMNKKHWNFLG